MILNNLQNLIEEETKTNNLTELKAKYDTLKNVIALFVYENLITIEEKNELSKVLQDEANKTKDLIIKNTKF